MSWIKLLLGGAVIGFCILLGYFAAEKYRSRKLFFAQLSAFNTRYLNELSYARKPLSSFLASYKYSKEFGKIIDELQKKHFIEVNFSFLSKDERNYLYDYFSMLGKGDSRTQSGYFSAQTEVLNEKKTESEKEAKTRNELYLKLGLLAGLAFVILIV